jgi:uroporphyrinogen III methyltransferase/synthase
VAAYQIVHEFGELTSETGAIDLVLLPSSSAASLLLRHESGAALRDIPMVAMGPETEIMARRYGVRDIQTAPHDDVESIISCTLQRFASISTVTEAMSQEEHFSFSSKDR